VNTAAQSRRSFLARVGAAAGAVAAAALPRLPARAAPVPDGGARAEAWNAVELVGSDGQAITLGQIAAPVVVVHVWASWCPACLDELASVQGLAERLGPAGLATILVSHPRNWERDLVFLRRTQVRLPAYTLAPDVPWAMREAVFDMTGSTYAVPRTLVFAGRDRRCVLAKEGPENWQSPQVAARLRSWLRSGPA
jgi:thiol-disulfide isomerase/thioredoxin